MPKKNNKKEVEEAAGAANDNDDNENDEPSGPLSPKGGKMTNNDKRKLEAKKRSEDAKALKEAQRNETRDRIVQRFLQCMLIGPIMDLVSGSDGKNELPSSPKRSSDSPKRKKAESSDPTVSLSSLWNKFGSFLIPGVVFIAVMYGKAMEDLRGGHALETTDFYGVMGLSQGADISEVRKQYKQLAITLHPDKNPDCADCAEKFDKVSKAYDVLSNAASKKEYDTKGITVKKGKSDVAVDLTAADFESTVLRSNDVWIVQAFDASSESNKHFQTMFEHLGHKYQNYIKFGRIDVVEDPSLMNYLPQRIRIFPVIYRFARGEDPEVWELPGREEMQKAQEKDVTENRLYEDSFRNWMADAYPNVINHKEDTSSISSFWQDTSSARVLIGAPSKSVSKGIMDTAFFRMAKSAFVWGNYARFAVGEPKDVTEVLEKHNVKVPQAKAASVRLWTITYIPAGETSANAESTWVSDPKEAGTKIEELVSKALKRSSHHLTSRSAGQLCSSAKIRTLCLVLVDHSDSEAAKVVSDLEASEKEYAKEQAENRAAQEGEEAAAAAEGAQDDNLQIQAVRVSTSTSRFPGQAFGVPSDFYTVWDAAGRAPMFLVEMDARKVAAVKPAILGGVHAAITYEDLKLKELPDDFEVHRILPDPELRLKQDVLRKVTSPLGALCTWVLLASVSAIAPELAREQQGILGGVIFAIIVAVYPLASRRLLSLVLGGN